MSWPKKYLRVLIRLARAYPAEITFGHAKDSESLRDLARWGYIKLRDPYIGRVWNARITSKGRDAIKDELALIALSEIT